MRVGGATNHTSKTRLRNCDSSHYGYVSVESLKVAAPLGPVYTEAKASEGKRKRMNQARNSRGRKRNGILRREKEGRESARFRLSRLFSSLLRRKPWLFLTSAFLAPSHCFVHTFVYTGRFLSGVRDAQFPGDVIIPSIFPHVRTLLIARFTKNYSGISLMDMLRCNGVASVG